VGLLLRLLLIYFPRPSDDDLGVYLELGHNLLHHGIYGIADGDDISPSLFRLPGYPLFLATLELVFGRFWLYAVFTAQVLADLASGMLLAAFARRHISNRAGEITLALAMLCPFTAAYAGIAMTECLSIFAISLGLYSVGRALAKQRSGKRDLGACVLAGCASALAMLLRPDGAILTAVLGASLLVYSLRNQPADQPRNWRQPFLMAALFSAVALLPLLPWTLRNWNEFHVFQPLAPRYVNDPDERVNSGFYRWLRTWTVEYATTWKVFWHVGQSNIDPNDLPSRAFDSWQQKAQTLELIANYNQWHDLSQQLDDKFGALADQRLRSHPLRYYIVLPLMRVADMALRPRTDTFTFDIYWWRFNNHPRESIGAILIGLINLGYFVLAALAFLRGRVPWAWMMLGLLLFRFVLLATMENPEPRYTMQCYPILILAAAAMLAGKPNPTKNLDEPQPICID
jgi:hypothetical protein